MLKEMRADLRSHDCILQHLCTMEIEESGEFSILSNFADGGDLNTFLHEPFIENFAEHSNAILQEASKLSDALDYLHVHFKTKNLDGNWTRKPCYHMDLKPENILVFYGPSPVGVWRITDFGLSVLHDVINKNSDESGNSRTPSRRPPGTFQAPEVQERDSRPLVNARTDIWSYGGILCMVLAFTVEGPKTVKFLEMIRSTTPTGEEGPDRFYELGEEGTSDPPTAILKPQISRWLESMEEDSRTKELRIRGGVLEVIRKCFEIDAKLRPSARDVFEHLNHVLTNQPAQTTRSTISRRTETEDPAQSADLVPALNTPPKRTRGWRPNSVAKHLRTTSQPGPGIFRLSSPISTRPRHVSDSPMMPTPSTSSSRASLKLSSGHLQFVKGQHAASAGVIGIDQNANHLYWPTLAKQTSIKLSTTVE